MLWIRGRPVAKCDPLLDRAIQHNPRSRRMGDLALDNGNTNKQKHANVVLITKNNFLLKISQNNSGNQEMIKGNPVFHHGWSCPEGRVSSLNKSNPTNPTMGGPVGDP